MELRAYLQILIRRRWIVLPAFIVTFISTVVFTLAQPNVYEAKATFVVRVGITFADDRSLVSALDTLSRRAEIAGTYAEVASSRRIKNLAADQLGLPSEQISKLSVSSRLIAGTNLLEITAEGPEPALVRDFTNATGEQTILYAQKLYETFELESLDPARLPRSPVRPNKGLNLFLGGVFGLILGMGLAVLAEYLQMTPQSDAAPNPRPPKSEKDKPASEMPELQQTLTTLQTQSEAAHYELMQIAATLRNAGQRAETVIAAGNENNGDHFEPQLVFAPPQLAQAGPPDIKEWANNASQGAHTPRVQRHPRPSTSRHSWRRPIA